MCELVRYHGAKSMIDFSTILCVFDELVVFLIDRTTLWQEFMIHHAIAIEENTNSDDLSCYVSCEDRGGLSLIRSHLPLKKSPREQQTCQKTTS